MANNCKRGNVEVRRDRTRHFQTRLDEVPPLVTRATTASFNRVGKAPRVE